MVFHICTEKPVIFFTGETARHVPRRGGRVPRLENQGPTAGELQHL
jgi:hypothetical protein